MWGSSKRKCELLDTKDLEGLSRRKKETRTIKMGLGLVGGTGLKVIRSNQGGGPAHNFSVSKQCNKADLIAMGKHIFFPNQRSTIGHESEFTFDIQLGRGISMGDDDTLESFFVASKNLYLRLYLACTKLCDLPRFIDSCEDRMSLINEEYESDAMQRESVSNDAVYLYKEIKVKSLSVFDDLLAEFSNEFWLDCDYNFVYVNMVVELPNGETIVNEEKETTFKKCLTGFWKEFYALCTVGSKFKVPRLRHDFGELRWLSIAKILAIGWVKMRYFPILLSPPFINACLQQEPIADLTEPFLLYLHPADSKIISNALHDIENVEKNELTRIFSDMNVKIESTISKYNLHQIIQEVAHLIHFQQPAFIINCWRAELRSVAMEITQECLQEIYRNLVPNSDKLISVLRFEQINSGRHESACGFLRRYLRDSDSDNLSKFLQLLTGSDMLTVDEIYIAFSDNPGFSKPTTASVDTIEPDLIVSTNYDNYDDFKNELNDVISRV